MNLALLRALFADMSFHPADGGAVIYDPGDKRLFALNETAAFVWLAVRSGISRETMTDELRTALRLPQRVSAPGFAESLLSPGVLQHLLSTVYSIAHGANLNKFSRQCYPFLAAEVFHMPGRHSGEMHEQGAAQEGPSQVLQHKALLPAPRLTVH